MDLIMVEGKCELWSIPCDCVSCTDELYKAYTPVEKSEHLQYVSLK